MNEKDLARARKYITQHTDADSDHQEVKGTLTDAGFSEEIATHIADDMRPTT